MGSRAPRPAQFTGHISSLINGISQQPAVIRFPNQGDECVNHQPTLQDQLGRRNPLETLFKLDNLAGSIKAGLPIGLLLPWTTAQWPFVHWYRRDANEGYSIVLTGDTIKVYSFVDGQERNVSFNIAGDDDYYVSDDPIRDFYCYTYKDTTFIVNRKKVARMVGSSSGSPYGLLLGLTQPIAQALSPSRPYEGLVVVKDAGTNFSYDVTLKIGANSTTVNTVASSGQTVNNVAINLHSALSGFVASNGGSSQVSANVIHVSHPSEEVSLEVSDNRAGSAMLAFMESIGRTADLPAIAPNGYAVKVTGSSSNQNDADNNVEDDVWYTFETAVGS